MTEENKVQLKQEELVGNEVVLTNINPISNTKSVNDSTTGEELSKTMDRIWQSINSKLSRIVNSVNGRTGVVVLNSDDVGLGNVDNVSFADIKKWVINLLIQEFGNKRIYLAETLDEIDQLIAGNDTKHRDQAFYSKYGYNEDKKAYVGYIAYNEATGKLEHEEMPIYDIGKSNNSIIYDEKVGTKANKDMRGGGIGVNIYKYEDALVLYNESSTNKDDSGLRVIKSKLMPQFLHFTDISCILRPQPVDSSHTPTKIVINGNLLSATYCLQDGYDYNNKTPSNCKFKVGDLILCDFGTVTINSNTEYPGIKTGMDSKLSDRLPMIGMVKSAPTDIDTTTNYSIEFYSITQQTGWGLEYIPNHTDVTDGDIPDKALTVKLAKGYTDKFRIPNSIIGSPRTVIWGDSAKNAADLCNYSQGTLAGHITYTMGYESSVRAIYSSFFDDFLCKEFDSLFYHDGSFDTTMFSNPWYNSNSDLRDKISYGSLMLKLLNGSFSMYDKSGNKLFTLNNLFADSNGYYKKYNDIIPPASPAMPPINSEYNSTSKDYNSYNNLLYGIFQNNTYNFTAENDMYVFRDTELRSLFLDNILTKSDVNDDKTNNFSGSYWWADSSGTNSFKFNCNFYDDILVPLWRLFTDGCYIYEIDNIPQCHWSGPATYQNGFEAPIMLRELPYFLYHKSNSENASGEYTFNNLFDDQGNNISGVKTISDYHALSTTSPVGKYPFADAAGKERDYSKFVVLPTGIENVMNNSMYKGGLIIDTDYSLCLQPQLLYGNKCHSREYYDHTSGDIECAVRDKMSSKAFKNWATPYDGIYGINIADHTMTEDCASKLGINICKSLGYKDAKIIDDNKNVVYDYMFNCSGLRVTPSFDRTTLNSEIINGQSAESHLFPYGPSFFGLTYTEFDKKIGNTSEMWGQVGDFPPISGGISINVGKFLEIDTTVTSDNNGKISNNPGKINVRIGQGLTEGTYTYKNMKLPDNTIKVNIDTTSGLSFNSEGKLTFNFSGSFSSNTFTLHEDSYNEGADIIYTPLRNKDGSANNIRLTFGAGLYLSDT